MQSARFPGVLLFACLAALTGCLPQTPPTQTATPTIEPGPTATATPGGARIDSFTVTPAEAYPGETVTLKWHTTGGFGAGIDKLLPNDTYGAHYSALPTTGELQVTLEEGDRNKATFILNLATAGDTVTGRAEVKVLCPVEWFFEGGPAETCALWSADRYAGPGLAQKFEHGQIIWNSADGWTVVLYDDSKGGWRRLYTDWAPGQPESDPALVPPEGLLQPVRQIGAIWRATSISDGPPRARLGWATAPEVALETNFQCDSEYFYDMHSKRPQRAPCFIATPDGVVRLYVDIIGADSYSRWLLLPSQ